MIQLGRISHVGVAVIVLSVLSSQAALAGMSSQRHHSGRPLVRPVAIRPSIDPAPQAIDTAPKGVGSGGGLTQSKNSAFRRVVPATPLASQIAATKQELSVPRGATAALEAPGRAVVDPVVPVLEGEPSSGQAGQVSSGGPFEFPSAHLPATQALVRRIPVSQEVVIGTPAGGRKGGPPVPLSGPRAGFDGWGPASLTPSEVVFAQKSMNKLIEENQYRTYGKINKTGAVVAFVTDQKGKRLVLKGGASEDEYVAAAVLSQEGYGPAARLVRYKSPDGKNMGVMVSRHVEGVQLGEFLENHALIPKSWTNEYRSKMYSSPRFGWDILPWLSREFKLQAGMSPGSAKTALRKAALIDRVYQDILHVDQLLASKTGFGFGDLNVGNIFIPNDFARGRKVQFIDQGQVQWKPQNKPTGGLVAGRPWGGAMPRVAPQPQIKLGNPLPVDQYGGFAGLGAGALPPGRIQGYHLLSPLSRYPNGDLQGAAFGQPSPWGNIAKKIIRFANRKYRSQAPAYGKFEFLGNHAALKIPGGWGGVLGWGLPVF